jgi:hypothetical protein
VAGVGDDAVDVDHRHRPLPSHALHAATPPPPPR